MIALVLRHHLHLGHGRHHPDHASTCRVVGHRRQGRGASEYEEEHGVASGDDAGADRLDRPAALRAYRLENADWAGKTDRRRSCKANPEYRIVNVVRGGEALGVDRRPARCRRATSSRSAAGARTMTEKMGLIGPEVSDRMALDIPLDRAEILVTNKDALKLTQRGDARAARTSTRSRWSKLERGGVPIPIGTDTKLQRMDVVTVVGLKERGRRRSATFFGRWCGRARRPTC